MYRSILVPLDGSLPSEQSLPYAAALARRSGASLQLAYVHTPLIVGEGVMYLGTPDVQLWEEEKQYLLRVVDRLKKAGLEKVSTHVLEGTIAQTLQEHALDEGCDLVVMTTHGRGPVSRFWLGSVADQLVHRLPIPLLLIHTREVEAPPAAEPEVRNVLVALDGTPTAEQLLEPVGGLAKVLGASLTLLRVVPSVVPQGVRKEKVPGALLADTLRAEAHVYLQRVANSLRDRGFAVQTRILAHAHPATAILNETASGEYDLLALETHGRRGLPRLFLGSVADKVVRGATVPVLVHRCLPG
ncbi:MAG TPA: universal stress protein [Gemmataceae bacterium]|jgi:nucleotide-binding universal stress UspA family protein